MESNNDRYQNRYRISSIRLQNWDYGWNAIYFVTICTKGRNHYFGEIIDGRMHLSPVGAIADVLWHELSHHFGNIELDAFVVMPNHIHGIIAINNANGGGNGGNGGNGETGGNGGNGGNGEAGKTGKNRRDNACVVSTVCDTSTSRDTSTSCDTSTLCEQQLSPMPKTIGQQRFQHQGEKTLSSIVGSYKSAVSRHAHRLGCDFAWQSRFYDAIIRDNRALIRVQSYIGNNPKNWKEDKFCER